ncbi:hypothetical protein L2E82_15451 [Cichorium intybus]|uniref:Uncharacterized protein n=1 Tax=Cichorium intybus TaxID=13427 RepID=A0ACB9F3E4_CICIN|nr:hypothetical protein L2E82_15451 [Cichorium intybus]
MSCIQMPSCPNSLVSPSLILSKLQVEVSKSTGPPSPVLRLLLLLSVGSMLLADPPQAAPVQSGFGNIEAPVQSGVGNRWPDSVIMSPVTNQDVYLFASMSQQKEGVLSDESKIVEEKDNNHDQDVEETIVSDDDVIDYSVKPEFYDPNLDDKDQLWIQKKRKGQYSDAVLTCPACFTTLCLECQRHEKYVTQYRAIFVLNCKIKKGQVSNKGSLKRKRVRKGGGLIDGESFSPVCCSVCETEVGVIDDDEVYHFYNVLPSEC